MKMMVSGGIDTTNYERDANGNVIRSWHNGSKNYILYAYAGGKLIRKENWDGSSQQKSDWTDYTYAGDSIIMYDYSHTGSGDHLDDYEVLHYQGENPESLYYYDVADGKASLDEIITFTSANGDILEEEIRMANSSETDKITTKYDTHLNPMYDITSISPFERKHNPIEIISTDRPGVVEKITYQYSDKGYPTLGTTDGGSIAFGYDCY